MKYNPSIFELKNDAGAVITEYQSFKMKKMAWFLHGLRGVCRLRPDFKPLPPLMAPEDYDPSAQNEVYFAKTCEDTVFSYKDVDLPSKVVGLVKDQKTGALTYDGGKNWKKCCSLSLQWILSREKFNGSQFVTLDLPKTHYRNGATGYTICLDWWGALEYLTNAVFLKEPIWVLH